MDPITIAAGISVVSGIVQAYNSEKSRGANKKRLDELKAAFDAIVPPQYDISINDPPQYMKEALGSANLDFSRLTPQQFKMVGQYSPEAAQYVAEKNPQLVQGTEAQKEGREAQISALRQMQQISKGESPELRIQMQRSADAAQAEAQSRQQSALQDAQRRGMGGSGLSFANALQGSSQAMQTGATTSQNAALAAYKDKLAAMQSAGQMGRQLSQDELSQEAGNVDILNAFNQRTTKAYQDYQTQRAAMQNQAQLQNLGMQQDIANRNTALSNETDKYNQSYGNQTRQQSYENTKGERNYQDQLAMQKATWAANEKDRQNQLKRQSYQDELSKAQGRAGIASQQMNQETQGAQDRNAAIGGIAGAASGYYGQQAADDRAKAAQAAEDARWDKYYKLRYPGQGVSDNSGSYASSYA
jgi:hypothetical protein